VGPGATDNRGGGRVGQGLVLGLVAAVPVIVATANALEARWTPISDDGVIVLRAFDVFTAHSPLVGQYTQSSSLLGTPAYSLGPMLYWALAIPARISADAVVLTTGAISAASVVGVVNLARRRGGAPLMVLVAGAMVLLSRALPFEAGYEVWNCWAGLFPFTLLVFIAWSLACGEYRLLPLAALVASYVCQVHLTYVIPTVILMTVGLGGLLLSRRTVRGVGRWAVLAAVLLLACWTPPVVQQLRHEPGNFTLVYRLATNHHPRAGAKAGWWTLSRAVGVPPSWMVSRYEGVANLTRDLVSPPTAFRMASTVLLLVALAITTVMGLRRRQATLAAAGAVAIGLSAAVVWDQASMPAGSLGFGTVGYTMTWTPIAGAFVWIAVAMGAAQLLPSTRRWRERWSRPAATVGMVAVASLAVAVSLRDPNVPEQQPPGYKAFREVRMLTSRVHTAVGSSERVFVDTPDVPALSPGPYFPGLTLLPAIALDLRRGGHSVTLPPKWAEEAGLAYYPGTRHSDAVVHISAPGMPVAPNAHVVARRRWVVVTLTH
jgi:hypothetical protein